MKQKLALGTVQFGLDYGINNTTGKVSFAEVIQILRYAYQQGINFLDTAQGYGESEQVIGKILEGNTDLSFQIVSKLSQVADPKIALSGSFEKLGQANLYAYMFHYFELFENNPHLLDSFIELKQAGRIQKIGFSLYYPQQLDFLLENQIPVDLIQIPYNIFDQRFGNYFQELKKKNIEIHVRSAFLQGLVFIKPQNLNPHFEALKSKMTELHTLSTQTQLSIESLCLNFVLCNTEVDKVVIGVDSLKNLEQNIKIVQECNQVSQYYTQLLALREDNEQLILPIHWKKS